MYKIKKVYTIFLRTAFSFVYLKLNFRKNELRSIWSGTFGWEQREIRDPNHTRRAVNGLIIRPNISGFQSLKILRSSKLSSSEVSTDVFSRSRSFKITGLVIIKLSPPSVEIVTVDGGNEVIAHNPGDALINYNHSVRAATRLILSVRARPFFNEAFRKSIMSSRSVDAWIC